MVRQRKFPELLARLNKNYLRVLFCQGGVTELKAVDLPGHIKAKQVMLRVCSESKDTGELMLKDLAL